jgi:hypothetical protein
MINEQLGVFLMQFLGLPWRNKTGPLPLLHFCDRPILFFDLNF